MKLRTRSEMRLYQRARRARLRAGNTLVTSNTGVTDARRVIRTEHDNKWFPPPVPLEEKLLVDLREQTRIQDEAEEAHEKIERKLEAYYESLGIIDPEQCASKRHLTWLVAKLKNLRREIRGYSKAKEAERERIDGLIHRTIEIKKQRYSGSDLNYHWVED
jgi:hypothetical protein